MTPRKPFPSAALLQRYLLEETGPGDLVLVPQRRLARQVWHKQRLAAREKGLGAWEPLPLLTLPQWWRELYQHLWPPYALAPPLVRLALWQRAMSAGPPLEGATPDLPWSQALDEAHELLLRNALPLGAHFPDDPPLVRWRREVSKIFRELLRADGWLTPGEMPGLLLAALEAGSLPLPRRLVVVGLETPAAMERYWLEAVARRLPVTRVTLRGDPGNLAQALVFPDQEEEMAWAAAQLLEWQVREGLPLNRLAVTSPDMDRYAPRFQAVLRELFGPAAGDDGFTYNLSWGPSLAETPLWTAALLPLAFLAQGERREELTSLLLSPYYQACQRHQGFLAVWDRLCREQGAAQGWEQLKAALRPALTERPDLAVILATLDRLWTDAAAPRRGRDWVAWLREAWRLLGFPGGLGEGEPHQFHRTAALLGEFATACGHEVLTPAGVLAWLSHGARQQQLSGPGHPEAGVQVLGWLEMRGLDFDRAICLGMNSAALPGGARHLPLLSRTERDQVLGGTQDSQDFFSRELFDNFLGTAPHLILTRPVLENQEPQVGTPFFRGVWTPARLPWLSQPHPAWVRVPLVRAALTRPEGGAAPGELQGVLPLTCPGELKVTQLANALGCLLRFVLTDLLGLRELPEIDSGLDPRERGHKVHQILARFVELAGFQPPPGQEADNLLRSAARQALGREPVDLLWQAEWQRWFGDDQTPGLLPAWLALERERLTQGWRWLRVEAPFRGLRRPGWPFALRGRLDRLDYHPERREFMVWDYKTGDIPNAPKVFERLEEFQLPAYLLAVREGCLEGELPAASAFGAGFIGLKSPREDHLRHQDFAGKQDHWPGVLAAWEEEVRRLGERLLAGEVRPAPRPAPWKQNEGACAYCPFDLICNYQGVVAEDGEGEE